MPSFGDTALIALIALLLFGPKKLPELARQLGKLMGEFRRASNEFRMQMEDELRISEQADQQKKIAAMEAAAPLMPPVLQEESRPIDASSMVAGDIAAEGSENSIAASSSETWDAAADAQKPERHTNETTDGLLPIASYGDLDMMPPSTGLPASRTSGASVAMAFDSIPHTQDPHSQGAETVTPPVPELSSNEAPVHG